MKIRLYKKEMKKALWWYTQKLHEKHLNVQLTPARIQIIRNDLLFLQANIQLHEPNVIWKIPVTIFVNETFTAFEAVVEDETNLLYLDFDQP
jgi:hypothetical protein